TPACSNMTRLVDQPLPLLATLLSGKSELSPRTERLLTRLTGVFAGVLSSASEDDLAQLEQVKSVVGLAAAVADLVARQLSPGAELRLRATIAGWMALADAIDAEEGLLTERQVLQEYSIDAAELRRYEKANLLLVLRTTSGLELFPAVQFGPPRN